MTAAQEAPGTTEPADAPPARRPRGDPTADVLVLGRAGLAGLPLRLTHLTTQVIDEAAAFLAALGSGHPRVVVVTAPPATRSTIEAVAAVRQRRPAMRAVLVDEAAAVDERLSALESGYDAAFPDDMPHEELAGRIYLLSRRPTPGPERLPICEGMLLDVATHALVRDGRSLHLRPKEFRLLEVLVRHPGRVYSRSQLFDRVWGPTRAEDERTVDVHVRWLRVKLEPDPQRPVHLVTIRGLGYRLDPDGC